MDTKKLAQALRDTAQSASNSVADNVAVPVDLIAWALRQQGLNIDKPVGGSDWMRENGLTAPVQNGIPKQIGDAAGIILPSLMFGKTFK